MALHWEAGTTRLASSFAICICQWLSWREVELSLVVRFMYMYMYGILRIRQAEAPLNVMIFQTTEGQGSSKNSPSCQRQKRLALSRVSSKGSLLEVVSVRPRPDRRPPSLFMSWCDKEYDVR